MVIEDTLAQNGLVPDFDDEALGAAYASCPAIQKSVIKNAVSFAYALSQTGREPLSGSCRFGHVERTEMYERLHWALFAVDARRFPVTAMFSAMVLALTAKVETLVVHVSGPTSDAFLFGCDFLSVDQIFRGDPKPLLKVLAKAGQGAVVDFAGLDLDYPYCVRPDPCLYGVCVHNSDSEYARAYHAVTAETCPQSRVYIAYGEHDGRAPVTMSERLLGCWVWDVISPATFRRTTSIFA